MMQPGDDKKRGVAAINAVWLILTLKTTLRQFVELVETVEVRGKDLSVPCRCAEVVTFTRTVHIWGTAGTVLGYNLILMTKSVFKDF